MLNTMNELTEKNPIIITKKGTHTEFTLKDDIETAWMNQIELATFFNISKKELIQALTTLFKKSHIDKNNHTRRIHYIDYSNNKEEAKHETQYSLLIIIELGFHLNSDLAIAFQQWATKLLHRHLTWGTTFNLERVKTSEKRIHHSKKNTQKLDSHSSNNSM